MDEQGRLRKRIRHLPRSQWAVLIEDHHPGFIDWQNYEMNQVRISQNCRPRPHQAAGAVREGAALLQGIASCGHCGRSLQVYYQGQNSTPGYYCAGSHIVNGRGTRCLRVGGVRLDQVVAQEVLRAVASAEIQAALQAQENLESERETALAGWRLQLERVGYQAQRAERRYRSVEPENRLVARTLEAEWEQRLDELAAAEEELGRRQRLRSDALTDEQRQQILALGSDLSRAWKAPTTTDRDRKQLLRTLLEEVNISIDKVNHQAQLILRWQGGLISELSVQLLRRNRSPLRTDEDTLTLVRSLAQHYPDALIAGSSAGKASKLLEDFLSRPIGSGLFAVIGRFLVSTPQPIHLRDSWSPSRKQLRFWEWLLPQSIDGWQMALSPGNKSLPVLPGRFGSMKSFENAFWKRHHPDTSPCNRPLACWASHVKPCCSV